MIGKVERILLPAFGKAGPVPSSIRSILDGVGDSQSGAGVRELLQLPIMQAMTDALVTVLAKSWQFVISVAVIYLGGVLIYSIIAPPTDSYLSNRVFVRLNKKEGLFLASEAEH